MYSWKKGISLSFFKNEKGEPYGLEKDTLRQIREHGIDCVELSFSYEDYVNRYHFTQGTTAEELYEFCTFIGLQLWSMHLPFSEKWDLSGKSAEEALAEDEKLLKAAERAHISVAVIHPSYEPVPEEDRSSRIACAKEYLRRLNDTAEQCHIRLALENLPRTCLGNTSEEMLELLGATHAHFIFDTNHSLREDNLVFLQNMIRGGYCPVSLHISDYDFVDERHDLPGCGVNPWKKLMDTLQTAGYSGPALYEIRHVVSAQRVISLEELTGNMEQLLAGRI